MKRTLSILLVLLICLSLSACKQEPEQPIRTYETLEEINSQANVNICKPAVMGVTEEKFSTGDHNTALYQFELNGYSYYVRACKDTINDVSDLFKNNKPLFEGCTEKIAFDEATGYKACRFILGNRQYVFGVYDEEKMNQEDFESQALSLIDQMINQLTLPEIQELVGKYEDSTSKRAAAEVKLADDINQIIIDITWPNASSSYDEWKCQCYINMGKAIYDTISHTTNEVDEQGNVTPTSLDDYGQGYFTLKENQILWDGSENEITQTCVFKKIN